MPKALHKDAQEMVASLISYFEQECANGAPLLPLTSVRDRVAAALSISHSTVCRIAAKITKGEPLTTPKKKHEREKPVVDIDNFDQCAIRNNIYEMYRNKDHLTLDTLKDRLGMRDIFLGARTSLWRIIKNIGFKYKKDDPRRGLMELPNIAAKRTIFLQKYVQEKQMNLRKFVFLDETWIFQDGTISRSWQDDSVKSVKKLKVGGSRYIILHAGNENGFIPGADLVFSSKTNSADYHGEMNQENFLNWFQNQLLPNLSEPSTIVMDNASYHSIIKNKCPSSTWKKSEVQKWLMENHIPFDPSFLKPQLLQLVKMNKPPPIYVVDDLAEQYGHSVLRLPPYHCIFNPIEHIWGICKNYYRDHIGKDGRSFEKSIEVWREALQRITPEVTEQEIERWWERELHFDLEDITPIVIHVDDIDTSDEDD